MEPGTIHTLARQMGRKRLAGGTLAAAMFYYSRDRGGEHIQAHLARWSGLLQADAYAGYNQLYVADRTPAPILEAACWAHARRPFFALADIEASARRRSSLDGSPARTLWGVDRPALFSLSTSERRSLSRFRGRLAGVRRLLRPRRRGSHLSRNASLDPWLSGHR